MYSDKFNWMYQLENWQHLLSNREKTMRPKKSKFWCKHCDTQLVGEYSKCPVCGKRNGRKRFKAT